MCGLSYRQHVVNGRIPFHCRVATPSGRRWPRHCLTAHGYRAPLPRRPGCLSAAFHLPRRVTCRPIVADLPPRQRWLRRSTRRGLNIAVTGETFRYPFLPVRSWARSPPRPVFGLPGELGCGRGAAVIERPCKITTWRQRILNTGTTVAERGASADTLRVGDHDTGARVTGEHDTGDQNYERPRQGTSQYGRPRHG